MECAICFHEVQKFKILTCGHFFCEKCVEKICGGQVILAAANQTNLKSPSTNGVSADATFAAGPESLTREFECPKCRKNTAISLEKGLKQLRSKFVGNLHCFQCDEGKSVAEFRWCHTCLRSVCSTCFVDKHSSTTDDGTLNLHTASKWEDYKAVEFCLSQLKLQVENSANIVDKTKEYLHHYLSGLEEFLSHELELKSRSGHSDLEKDAKVLAEAFGIAWDQIPVAKDENQSFQYLLPEIVRLSGIDAIDQTRFSENNANLKMQSIPYPEISRHLLSNEKKPFEPIWFDAQLFKEKSKESYILGGNLIKQPSDMCLLSEDILLISDYESGIFVFKDHCLLQGPIPLKHGYRNYTRIITMPCCPTSTSSNSKETRSSMAFVIVQHTHWSFMVLKTTPSGTVEHEKIGGSVHWALPTNKSLPMTSSDRNLFLASGRTLWKFMGVESLKGKSEIWKDVYTMDQENQHHYHRLGPVFEKETSSEVVLLNTVWSSADIITISHEDKLWGVRRIEIGLPIGPKCLRELREPFLVQLSPDGRTMILADKLTPKLFLWTNFAGIGGQNRVQELIQFGSKMPQRIVYDAKHRIMFLIVQHGDHSNMRCFEMIQL